MWKPTLVLRHRHKPTASARFTVATMVCARHKSGNADVFICDDAWKAFLAYFDERKLDRPHRSLTLVEYTRVEATDPVAHGPN